MESIVARFEKVLTVLDVAPKRHVALGIFLFLSILLGGCSFYTISTHQHGPIENARVEQQSSYAANILDHLTNPSLALKQLTLVLAHATCALLFFLLLCGVTQPAIALWGALYFGLHPTVGKWLPKLSINKQVFITLLCMLIIYGAFTSYKKSGFLPIAHSIILLSTYFRWNSNPFSIAILAPLIFSVIAFWPSIKQSFSSWQRRLGKIVSSLVLGFASLGMIMLLGVSLFATWQTSPTFSPVDSLSYVINVFGISWIPARYFILQLALLIFWLISMTSLWLKSSHQSLLWTLFLTLATTGLPGLFIPGHEGEYYGQIALFIMLLVMLYEYSPHHDLKRYLRALVVPLYGTLLFTSILLVRTLLLS